MVFTGLNNIWLRYPPGKLRRTRRAFWRVVRKAEDAGLPAQVKDDNAANGGPERPAGMCVLVSRCYNHLYMI